MTGEGREGNPSPVKPDRSARNRLRAAYGSNTQTSFGSNTTFETIDAAVRSANPDPKLPRKEFLSIFNSEEKEVFSSFSIIFKVVLVYSALLSMISFIFILSLAYREEPILIVLQAIPNVINYGLIFWIAYLVSRFFELRRLKIENDAYNADRDREYLKEMTVRKIDELRERSQSIIAGDNSVIISNGSNSGTITISVTGGRDVTDAVALLITFARESGNSVALERSKELASESGKPSPDKAKVFSLWNGIVEVLPDVVKLADVVKGIGKLIGLPL